MLNDLATSNTQRAVAGARRCGLPIPQPITDAEAMWDVVLQAAHHPYPDRPTVDTLPDTPDALAEMIAEHARAYLLADSHRHVASSYGEPVGSRYHQAVRAAVPAWIAMLTPKFNAATKAVGAAARKLPADVRAEAIDWDNPVFSAAWEQATGAAAQLDQLVNDRQAMARAIGTDTGRDARLYAVAAFPEPDLEQVMSNHWLTVLAPFVAAWHEHRANPVSRWITLVRGQALGIELSLATPHEVAERAAVVGRWQAGSLQRQTAGSLGAARAAVTAAIRPKAA